MQFLKTDGNGTVLKYPYNFRNLRLDNPNVSFPAKPGDTEDHTTWLAVVAPYNVFPVTKAPKPALLPTEEAIEQPPALVNGEWVINWTVQDTTATVEAKKDEMAITLADAVQYKLLFNHENRIRALEGKQPVTKQQFITAIRNLM